METLKSYTDIEQSKKLAEILPLESADMVIWGKDLDAIGATDAQKLMKGLKDRKMNYIPCWSLAALLSILPANKLEKQFDGKWWFSVYLPSGQHKSHKHDNPIEACVEVILNLHKLNLL